MSSKIRFGLGLGALVSLLLPFVLYAQSDSAGVRGFASWEREFAERSSESTTPPVRITLLENGELLIEGDIVLEDPTFQVRLRETTVNPRSSFSGSFERFGDIRIELDGFVLSTDKVSFSSGDETIRMESVQISQIAAQE